MDAAKARDILAFALEHQNREAPVPEDDEMAIEEATTLLGHAWLVWSKNQYRGPDVEGLLRLADETWDGTGTPAFIVPDAATEPEPVAEPVAAEPETPTPSPNGVPLHPPATVYASDDERRRMMQPWEGYDDDSVQVVNSGLDAALGTDDEAEVHLHVWTYEHANKARLGILRHLSTIGNNFRLDGEPVAEPAQPPAQVTAEPTPVVDSDEMVAEYERQFRAKRLHIPAAPEGDAPVLPYDSSRLSDKELRELHHAFGAYAYYADSEYDLHASIAAWARAQADELARELLVAAAQYDEKGRERRLAVITAEIETDPNVKRSRAAQRRHEILAEAQKRERDSYKNAVEFLSRQESMRMNEFLRGKG